jgi:hypothetical protein
MLADILVVDVVIAINQFFLVNYKNYKKNVDFAK